MFNKIQYDDRENHDMYFLHVHDTMRLKRCGTMLGLLR